MLKKIGSFAAVLLASFGLAGCGQDSPNPARPGSIPENLMNRSLSAAEITHLAVQSKWCTSSAVGYSETDVFTEDSSYNAVLTNVQAGTSTEIVGTWLAKDNQIQVKRAGQTDWTTYDLKVIEQSPGVLKILLIFQGQQLIYKNC